VFISTGEASGDRYGATLLIELRRLGFDGRAQAIGGHALAGAGAEIVADSRAWGAIGVLQAAKVFWRVWKGFRVAQKALREGPPGLLIPIDFGFANIRLVRTAKKLGWKVLYFVPPGSWRKDRQGKDLPALTDAISTPFPWSEKILHEAGANAYWFGHPIKQLIGDVDASARGERETLAVLPGSRRFELLLNMRIIAEAVRSKPYPIEFGLAPAFDLEATRALWIQLTGRTADVFTQGDLQGVFSRARAAVVCSGTATLEAALYRCPMVVVYRVTKAMHLEGWLVGMRDQVVSLPNILLGRKVIPEILGGHFSPEVLETAIDRVYHNAEEQDTQQRSFAELDAMLGPSDAITKTARLAIDLLEQIKKGPASREVGPSDR
jgi:lipid-A-disaccharide synthase